MRERTDGRGERADADGSRPSRDEADAGADAELAARDADTRLDILRRRILQVDQELIRLVGERRDLVLEVGRLKEELGLPVMDPGREAEVVKRAARTARELGVDEELVRDVVWRIIAAARDAQEDRSRWGPPPGPPHDTDDDSASDEG